jgi:hypothetical protein
LRRPRAQSGRCARARWCGDVRRRTPRHSRTLRRRSRTTMDLGSAELGSWPCNAWCSLARRCGEMRRRTRRHGRTLWRGSRTKRRCGEPGHCRRRRRASHGGGCRRTSHSGRCRRSSRCRRRPGPFLLLGRCVDARRDHADAKHKSCKANASQKHNRSSMVFRRPQAQRASAEIVRLRASPLASYWHCDFATQGNGEHKALNRCGGRDMFRRRKRSACVVSRVNRYRSSEPIKS